MAPTLSFGRPQLFEFYPYTYTFSKLPLSRNSKEVGAAQRRTLLTTTSLWVINRDHLGVNQGRLALPFQIRISLRAHLDLHKSVQRRWWFVMSHMSYVEEKKKKRKQQQWQVNTLSHVSLFYLMSGSCSIHKNLLAILLCGCVLSFRTCCSSAAYYVWGDMPLCVKWQVSGNMQEGGDSSKWVERLLGDFWQIKWIFSNFSCNWVICCEDLLCATWTITVLVILLPSPKKQGLTGLWSNTSEHWKTLIIRSQMLSV